MADTLISNTVIYSYTHSFCAMLCMNKKVKITSEFLRTFGFVLR